MSIRNKDGIGTALGEPNSDSDISKLGSEQGLDPVRDSDSFLLDKVTQERFLNIEIKIIKN